MEFYKLYCIIHRRTDWFRLYKWQREIMMPEYYEERRQRGELAMKKFAIASALVGSLNSPYSKM